MDVELCNNLINLFELLARDKFMDKCQNYYRFEKVFNGLRNVIKSHEYILNSIYTFNSQGISMANKCEERKRDREKLCIRYYKLPHVLLRILYM